MDVNLTHRCDQTMLPQERIDGLTTDGNRKAKMRVRKGQRLLSINEPAQTMALACRSSLNSDFLTESSDLLDNGIASANVAVKGKATHSFPLKIGLPRECIRPYIDISSL